jgi:hypothetical protein
MGVKVLNSNKPTSTRALTLHGEELCSLMDFIGLKISVSLNI